MHNAHKLPPELGELILHAGRHFRIDDLLKNAEPEHLCETLVQDFRRQPFSRPHHRSRPVDAILYLLEHVERPLAADDALDHLVRGWAIDRWNFCRFFCHRFSELRPKGAYLTERCVLFARLEGTYLLSVNSMVLRTQ